MVLFANWKGTLGRTRHRREDDITVDLKGIGWDCAIRICFNSNRERSGLLLDAVINLLIQSNTGNFSIS